MPKPVVAGSRRADHRRAARGAGAAHPAGAGPASAGPQPARPLGAGDRRARGGAWGAGGGRGAAVAPAARAQPRGPAHRGDAATHAAHRGRPAAADRAARRLRGEQVRSRAPAELLAAWVREPPRWGDDVRRLVQEALPSLHGDEGRLLAWALAEPETRLRDAVSGLALACGARIVYISPAEPRGYGRPRREGPRAIPRPTPQTSSAPIHGHGANQQIVGINTKCPAWNWVVRRNVIADAGTGTRTCRGGSGSSTTPSIDGSLLRSSAGSQPGFWPEPPYAPRTRRIRVGEYVGLVVGGALSSTEAHGLSLEVEEHPSSVCSWTRASRATWIHGFESRSRANRVPSWPDKLSRRPERAPFNALNFFNR